MATMNPISSSCHSIVSAGNPTFSTSMISLGSSCIRNTASHYVNGTGSLGRLKYHHKHKSLDASDEELDYSQLSQSTHILGRVKSDRFLASKPDEDRRRRTIIVEKKKDSFGFTLQSYGIHYKCDEEVEMITYVDYVEYDGPAYKAGMREGDVILSINGVDMEKADHKALVDFIKQCEVRMRIVVLFEDCVRKVDLHMRYIQLQNMMQSKINELERVRLRELELLKGKWTHSLPARKKAITPDADIGVSPTEVDAHTLAYYRPTLSTEDVVNMARHHTTQPQAIIPPPAQYMLTYHYLHPTYRYVLKPATSTSSTDYMVTGSGIERSPSDQHFILQHAESVETTTASQRPKKTNFQSQQQQQQLQQQQQQQRSASTTEKPPAPPPRTCEKHKPPSKQQQLQQQQTKVNSVPHKIQKSSKHCHSGHSCNPCLGHFRWKSAEKAAIAPGTNGDNVSLEAYDLASPCCDTHCVPLRKHTRHRKEHTYKHKHTDRERDGGTDMRQPRAKSQLKAYTSPSGNRRVHSHHHHNHGQAAQQQQPLHHHHHHQLHQQQQQHQKQTCDSHTGSIRSRYFDLASGLASHCSLHSCTSSEFAPADSTSYTTSISTDTLFWEPKSDDVKSRQHLTKTRQSYEQQTQQQQQSQQSEREHQQQMHPHQHMHSFYQQRYHITATQIQPSQIYPNTAYVYKPKSWDNLPTKTIGGCGFGYGYLDTVTVKPVMKMQIAQQRHSIPRKNSYGRYSTYTDVENYAPPPSEFVEELTTTTTTTITAKSTEELIETCECVTQQQQQQALKAAQYHLSQNQKFSHHKTCQMGYYSHLPRPTTDVATSTTSSTIHQRQQAKSADVETVTEVTRL